MIFYIFVFIYDNIYLVKYLKSFSQRVNQTGEFKLFVNELIFESLFTICIIKLVNDIEDDVIQMFNILVNFAINIEHSSCHFLRLALLKFSICTSFRVALHGSP